MHNQLRSPKPPGSVGFVRGGSVSMRFWSHWNPTRVAANRRGPTRPVPDRFSLRFGSPKSSKIRPETESETQADSRFVFRLILRRFRVRFSMDFRCFFFCVRRSFDAFFAIVSQRAIFTKHCKTHIETNFFKVAAQRSLRRKALRNC